MIVVSPCLFGVIHGNVGVLQNGVAIFAMIGKDGDTDAAGDDQGVSLKNNRVPESIDNLPGNLQSRLDVFLFRKHKHEFIAAEAGNGVFFPEDPR